MRNFVGTVVATLGLLLSARGAVAESSTVISGDIRSSYVASSEGEATFDARLLFDWENVRLTKGLNLTAGAYVRVGTDTDDAPVVRKLVDDSSGQPNFGFEDLYLDISKELVGLQGLAEIGRFRIGWQNPEWGRTDRVRPTNLLVAHDYTDLSLDDRRISQFGLSTKWGWERRRYTLELVWLPFFTPTRFATDGPWRFLSEGVNLKRELPEGADSQFGLRGCYDDTFVVCLMGYTGRDHLPFVDAVAGSLVYPEMRAFGGDFQKELFWGTMFRAEGVWRSYDGEFGRNYGEFAVSLEKIWPSTFYGLIQYLRQVPKRSDPADAHAAFNDAVFWRVSYGDENDGWYEQLEGAVNIDPTMVFAEVSVSGPTPVKDLRFTLGARVITGERENLISGRFSGNDGLFFEIRYRR